MNSFQVQINKNLFQKGKISLALQIKEILRTIPSTTDALVKIDELVHEICLKEKKDYKRSVNR